MAEPKMISPAQLRMIYGIARRGDMDDEILHRYAHYFTKKDSLKELTSREAAQLIDHLQKATGEKERNIPDRATEAQRKYIIVLASQLGMTVDSQAFRGFLRKYFGVDDIRFLTQTNASKVIEALKAMNIRKQAKEDETK